MHQVSTLREVGGFSSLSDWAIIEIAGADACQFLQSRVTSDVKALNSGQGQASALLDRKAHLLASFSVHRLGDKYFIVAEKSQINTIIEQLELFHFAESVTFTKLSHRGWTVQGPYAPLFIKEIANSQARVDDFQIGSIQDSESSFWIKRSLTGEQGFLLFLDKNLETSLVSKYRQILNDLGLVELNVDTLNVARIEAGLPSYGVDVISDNLLPETGLDEACVSYTKGCYLGQEVIARVKAQGAPRRGLMGLIFKDQVTEPFELDSEIFIADKAAGNIKSNTFSPTLGKFIAMALLSREFRVPNQEISIKISTSDYKATVVNLPFYKGKSNSELAKSLYDRALAIYAAGEETQSIQLLKKALKLDPTHGDSYEMLGVMLGKLGQMDEAIALMKQLVQIDPHSVMAHANLSIFYVQLGDKEMAEEEKALAMTLRMQQAAQEMSAQKTQEEDKQQLSAEARQRMGMFEQVLQIDSEDLLANFGLGNLHVELGEFASAIPYLRKAIVLKPNYTAAYLALGLALAGTNQIDESIKIFNEGITVATQRGDFEPMNKMKEKLASLEAQKVAKGD